MLTPEQINQIRQNSIPETSGSMSHASVNPYGSLSGEDLYHSLEASHQSNVESNLALPTSDITEPFTNYAGKVASSYANYLPDIKTDIQRGAEDIRKGFSTGNAGDAISGVVKGTVKAGLLPAAQTVGTLFSPVSSALGTVGDEVSKLTPTLSKMLFGDKTGDKGSLTGAISDNPIVQKLMTIHPNLGKDVGDTLNLLLAGDSLGESISPKSIAEGIKSNIDSIKPTPKASSATPIEPDTTSPSALVKDQYTKTAQKYILPSRLLDQMTQRGSPVTEVLGQYPKEMTQNIVTGKQIGRAHV